MSSGASALTEGEIFSRAIDSIDRENWRKLAQVISQLKLPDRDLNRVDHLLGKNREGTITGAERVEMETYLRVGNFLDLVKARALRERSQAPPT